MSCDSAVMPAIERALIVTGCAQGRQVTAIKLARDLLVIQRKLTVGRLIMNNPFKFVSDCFYREFNVRFSVEGEDGGATLQLSDEHGTVAQRRLSSEQLADQSKLEERIRSIRFGLAIDNGRGIEGLDMMSQAAANEPSMRE